MAIEDILNALEEQAQADVDAILREAKEHAELIGSQAQAEATAIHDNFARQVERTAKAKASKIVNAARLEAKMTVSSAKGDGLETVFEVATQNLAKKRSQQEYADLFARLADQAFEGLEGDVTIHVDPADASLAQAAAAKAGLSAEIQTDLMSAGGLVVEAVGGRIVRRNTFEDRLERARQFVQTDVAKALFA